MALPKHIEDAGQRADAIMEAQKGTPPQAPTENPVQQLSQTQENPPAPQQGEETWEQRFKVLQGKYSAEVPRLHGELKELKAQLQTAVTEMTELKNRVPEVPAAPDLSMLTAEEREQYGEDFVNFVAKVAKANAAKAAPDPNVVDRLNRVETVVNETREDKFFAKLKEQSPDWESLNTDTDFLTWLAESDPMSGRTRQQLFDEAYGKLDVDRVAVFFNTFAGANQSNVSRNTRTPSLEQQVTPPQNRSAPAPMQGKPYWTTRDIANFYTEVRRGSYRGRESDVARIEQDIFAAQKEGRVR